MQSLCDQVPDEWKPEWTGNYKLGLQGERMEYIFLLCGAKPHKKNRSNSKRDSVEATGRGNTTYIADL